MPNELQFSPPFSLHGKIAWITGGSRGIGFAIARCMIAAGARVVLTGRNAAALTSAQIQLGSQAYCYVHDVNDRGTHEAVTAKIEQEVGPIDILVNNAGINMKKPALEVSDEEFDRVLLTNLQGLYTLTKVCGQRMIQRNAGVIIMISSMAAYYGIDRVPAYTAAKSAVEGLVKALAEEWSPHQLRINAIAPGFIDTPMFRQAMEADPDRRHKAFDRTPLRRFGHPEDVGWAAVFLASEAAAYINGVSLRVDGGNAIGF